MDYKEALRGMLQDVINDRMEQAAVTMHDYFVAKTRQAAGLETAEDELAPSTFDMSDDDEVDETE
jgi:hypothetical protein